MKKRRPHSSSARATSASVHAGVLERVGERPVAEVFRFDTVELGEPLPARELAEDPDLARAVVEQTAVEIEDSDSAADGSREDAIEQRVLLDAGEERFGSARAHG